MIVYTHREKQGRSGSIPILIYKIILEIIIYSIWTNGYANNPQTISWAYPGAYGRVPNYLSYFVKRTIWERPSTINTLLYARGFTGTIAALMDVGWTLRVFHRFTWIFSSASNMVSKIQYPSKPTSPRDSPYYILILLIISPTLNWN